MSISCMSLRKHLSAKAFLSFFLLFNLVSGLCSATIQTSQVIPGDQVFVDDFPEELKDKRLGLVINHTAVLPDGTPLAEALLRKGISVRAIFSPEHGFKGIQEGGENIGDERWNNIKVFSLYGNTRRPTAEQMREIDAFVYDIQDVGTRFYTYITTLKYVLEAAAPLGIPVYVLDRPNPAGGSIVEGPILQTNFESYIGALPIPIRYGLTAGELAQMMKGEGWVPAEADLHVVKMTGWQRNYVWEDTGLPWIPTSPNIPNAQSALVYPGTGLLGGIILNQGLGTQEPFLLFGSPWMSPAKVQQSLPSEVQQGIKLEIIEYTPQAIPGKTTSPPYKDRLCQGMRIHVTDGGRFHAVHFTLALIHALKELYPDKIYQESQSLSLMFGTGELARFLRGELSYPQLLENMHKDEELFRQQRKPYLLY
jgi:uncharacterized protein YbbC (DUF1343 family)